MGNRAWPEGSALLSIDLFCRGIPSDQQQAYFEEAFPGHDFTGYFDSQVLVNDMIRRYTQKNPLSDDRKKELEEGRTAARKIPGGAVDRCQAHENTKALHAHISSVSNALKDAGGVSDQERKSIIKLAWNDHPNGSGKTQAQRDHANQLKTERNVRKAAEREEAIRKNKEDAGNAEI